jgi:hypothetical protein
MSSFNKGLYCFAWDLLCAFSISHSTTSWLCICQVKDVNIFAAWLEVPQLFFEHVHHCADGRKRIELIVLFCCCMSTWWLLDQDLPLPSFQLKSSIFWDIMLHGLLKVSQCFGGNVTSIFRSKEWAKQETNMKQVAGRVHGLQKRRTI